MVLHCTRLAEVCLTLPSRENVLGTFSSVLTTIPNLKKNFDNEPEQRYFVKRKQMRGQCKVNWRTEFLRLLRPMIPCGHKRR